MARQTAHNALDVYLNGKLVGQFRRERTGAVDFHYDQSWLDWENAIPVSLSLPLREDRYIGNPPWMRTRSGTTNTSSPCPWAITRTTSSIA